MHKGDKIEVPFHVNSNVYNGFISIFKDKNPLHTDETFAAQKGFKSVVMHGNILNGFLSYFIGECLPIKNVIIHSQQIDYKLPVYLNDDLMLKATIVNYSESVNVYEFNFHFSNAENKKVAKGKIQIGLLK
ncbi:MAG TPA: MaoC/PaaZ C-terminal domain-containing protein [Bacteroidia bacterium]|nr:MaoC/PaaZ C-terminal domain-containing protein [Bacteroidia bacterium]